MMLVRAAELRADRIEDILAGRRFWAIVEEHIEIRFVFHSTHGSSVI